jgi:hypothetical protein
MGIVLKKQYLAKFITHIVLVRKIYIHDVKGDRLNLLVENI